VVDDPGSAIVRDLAPGWSMTDEWYLFAASPRASGAHVLLTLDESTYRPEGFGKQDLRMGGDHPIAWTRCVRQGRAFYSAIGHVPAAYADPNHVKLLEKAVEWAAGRGETRCANGSEVKR
jgi:type 1 glutamine amidotransferase